MKFYLPTLKHLVIQLAKLQIYTLNLTTTFWHCKKKSHYFWTGVYYYKAGLGSTPELELELGSTPTQTPELELELELKPPELELELIFKRLAGVGVGVETPGVGVGVGVDIQETCRSWSWSWNSRSWSWNWSWNFVKFFIYTYIQVLFETYNFETVPIILCLLTR